MSDSLLDHFKRGRMGANTGFDWFESNTRQVAEMRASVRCALIIAYATESIGYAFDDIQVRWVMADVFEIDEREEKLNPRMKEYKLRDFGSGVFKPFYWYFGSQTDDRNWVLTPNGSMQMRERADGDAAIVRTYRVNFHNLTESEDKSRG